MGEIVKKIFIASRKVTYLRSGREQHLQTGLSLAYRGGTLCH